MILIALRSWLLTPGSKMDSTIAWNMKTIFCVNSCAVYTSLENCGEVKSGLLRASSAKRVNLKQNIFQALKHFVPGLPEFACTQALKKNHRIKGVTISQLSSQPISIKLDHVLEWLFFCASWPCSIASWRINLCWVSVHEPIELDLRNELRGQ